MRSGRRARGIATNPADSEGEPQRPAASSDCSTDNETHATFGGGDSGLRNSLKSFAARVCERWKGPMQMTRCRLAKEEASHAPFSF